MTKPLLVTILVLIASAGALAVCGLARDYKAQQRRRAAVAPALDMGSLPMDSTVGPGQLVASTFTSTEHPYTGMLVGSGLVAGEPAPLQSTTWTGKDNKTVVLTVYGDGRVDWHGDQDAAVIAFWDYLERVGFMRRTPDVQIGDRIRISVALLRDVYDQPEHESAPVTVANVETRSDGEKVLHLEKVEP